MAASHDVEVFSLLTLLEESVASDSVNSGEVPVHVLNLPICQSLKRGDPPDEGKLFQLNALFDLIKDIFVILIFYVEKMRILYGPH